MKAIIQMSEDELIDYYTDHPELFTVRNELGLLPLSFAYFHDHSSLVQMICDSDHCPKDATNGRIILDFKEGTGEPIYLTDDLNSSKFSDKAYKKPYALKIAHLILPVLNQADQRVIAKLLFEEATQVSGGLKRLIDEGFDITINDDLDTEPIIDKFIACYLAGQSNIAEIVQIEGMYFTRGVIYQLKLFRLTPHWDDTNERRLIANLVNFFDIFVAKDIVIISHSKLDYFKNIFENLLIDGVDLRRVRFEGNKTLVHVLCEFEPANSKAYLDHINTYSATRYPQLFRGRTLVDENPNAAPLTLTQRLTS